MTTAKTIAIAMVMMNDDNSPENDEAAEAFGFPTAYIDHLVQVHN